MAAEYAERKTKIFASTTRAERTGDDAGPSIKTKAGNPELLPVPASFLSTCENPGLDGRGRPSLHNLIARGCGRCRGCASHVGVAVQAAQTREERRNFKRHFVARRGDRHRCRLGQFHAVRPGVQFHASTHWKCGNLIQFAWIERRTRS